MNPHRDSYEFFSRTFSDTMVRGTALYRPAHTETMARFFTTLATHTANFWDEVDAANTDPQLTPQGKRVKVAAARATLDKSSAAMHAATVAPLQARTTVLNAAVLPTVDASKEPRLRDIRAAMAPLSSLEILSIVRGTKDPDVVMAVISSPPVFRKVGAFAREEPLVPPDELHEVLVERWRAAAPASAAELDEVTELAQTYHTALTAAARHADEVVR